MSILKDLLKRLPHNYKATTNSQIAKLFGVIATELAELKEAKNDITHSRSIDQAIGQTLDNLGHNVQQGRGQREDKTFRFFIKARIAINRSSGSISDIISIIANLLNIETEEIKVKERLDGEMASIYLSLPLKAINKIGLKRDEFLIVLNQILAAGVRPYTRLRGSFTLGDTADSSSTDQGFGDVNSNRGGYFGSWHN
jgi:hypothetical protein